jgi:leader peptidase (prepilin peptidase) / N-methyltransferase
MIFSHPAMMATLAFAGLLIGSHIAVMVMRWPQYRTALIARSRCDVCLRSLSAIELVPLASMIWLRGQCRHCAAPIALLHSRIELAALAVGATAGLAREPVAALAGAILGWQLLAISSIDITRLLLPNMLTIGIAATGLGSGLAGLAPALPDRLAAAALGFLTLWLVGRAYRRLRGHEGLGGGDPKLLGAVGCWLGWQPLPALLLLASGIGLVFVVLQRLRGVSFGRQHRLPFGAMLAAAAFLLWMKDNI